MTLDAETTERLSLDAALGQLDPDVRALWDAHVRDHPELAATSQRDAMTVSIAREALAANATAEPARLPARPELPHLRRARTTTTVKWATAVAAGLVIGLTLGLHVVPRTATPPGRGAQPSALTSPAAATAAPSADAENDNRFWSTERLYRQLAERTQDASRSSPRGAGRVTWLSPVKPKLMGDEL